MFDVPVGVSSIIRYKIDGSGRGGYVFFFFQAEDGIRDRDG